MMLVGVAHSWTLLKVYPVIKIPTATTLSLEDLAHPSPIG